MSDYPLAIHGAYGSQMCTDCIEDAALNVGSVIDYGAKRSEEVDINGLWAYIYTPEEINDILQADFEKLSKEKQIGYTERYVSEDYDDFANEIA